jgi:hypothetical protein
MQEEVVVVHLVMVDHLQVHLVVLVAAVLEVLSHQELLQLPEHIPPEVVEEVVLIMILVEIIQVDLVVPES